MTRHAYITRLFTVLTIIAVLSISIISNITTAYAADTNYAGTNITSPVAPRNTIIGSDSTPGVITGNYTFGTFTTPRFTGKLNYTVSYYLYSDNASTNYTFNFLPGLTVRELSQHTA